MSAYFEANQISLAGFPNRFLYFIRPYSSVALQPMAIYNVPLDLLSKYTNFDKSFKSNQQEAF